MYMYMYLYIVHVNLPMACHNNAHAMPYAWAVRGGHVFTSGFSN